MRAPTRSTYRAPSQTVRARSRADAARRASSIRAPSPLSGSRSRRRDVRGAAPPARERARCLSPVPSPPSPSFGDERGTRTPGGATGGEMRADVTQLRRRGDQLVVDPPRVEHGLREHQTRIARQLRLIEVAAVADDREDRQLPVMERIAQCVAGLEQAGALDHDDRRCPTDVEAGGDLPRLALAADAHESQ